MMDIPSFLIPYLESNALQRLKGIDMNCGVNHTAFPLFADIRPYSRYEHSLRCACLAWRYTDDRIQSLACLFHDIATPVFSHTVDFMNGDAMHQESTEENTESLIRNDPVITTQLQKDDIAISQVSDYHMYPICDNPTPHLCIDRLEYTCGNLVGFGFGTKRDVKQILDDIIVSGNEEGIPELCFRHRNIAEKFTSVAVSCGTIYSSCMDRYAMERLSILLNQALNCHIIDRDDLYTTESEVIQKIECSDLRDDWHAYCNMHKIDVIHAYREGYLRIHTKKRWIDPYIANKGRVSQFNETLRFRIHTLLQDDQNTYIKGE